jgi:hypothetical protein
MHRNHTRRTARTTIAKADETAEQRDAVAGWLFTSASAMLTGEVAGREGTDAKPVPKTPGLDDSLVGAVVGHTSLRGLVSLPMPQSTSQKSTPSTSCATSGTM